MQLKLTRSEETRWEQHLPLKKQIQPLHLCQIVTLQLYFYTSHLLEQLNLYCSPDHLQYLFSFSFL